MYLCGRGGYPVLEPVSIRTCSLHVYLAISQCRHTPDRTSSKPANTRILFVVTESLIKTWLQVIILISLKSSNLWTGVNTEPEWLTVQLGHLLAHYSTEVLSFMEQKLWVLHMPTTNVHYNSSLKCLLSYKESHLASVQENSSSLVFSKNST